MSLDIIRDATDKQLRDEAWLEDAIYRMGVYPAQEIHTDWWTREGGLGICQIPPQFAPYLVALSKLEITSYVEIGTWVGGTFKATTEYLRRFGLKKALAVDIAVKPEVRAYADEHDYTSWHEAPSTSSEAHKAIKAAKPDLILVDGDHTEEGARSDWEFARKTAPYVAIHDIVGSGFPGVIKVWDEIDLPKQEWTAQHPTTPTNRTQNGMGLVTVK